MQRTGEADQAAEAGGTELQRTEYLPTLDGWRAIAILGVVVCHACDMPLLEREGAQGLWYQLTRRGAEGVQLFFGLSGLLITWRLLQEQQRSGGIHLGRFYGRRALRILPPVLAYLGTLAVLAATGVLHVQREELQASLLFYRNFLPSAQGGWYTGHFWTLAIEEHFYLLWPALLGLLGPRRALVLAAVLAVGLAGWRWVDIRFQPLTRLLPEVVASWRTDMRIDGLLWGAFVALVLFDARREFWLRRLYGSRLTWGALALLAWVCLRGWLPLNAMWWALLLPLIMAGTVLMPSGRLARLLESPVLAWVGRLSYSLYVWQQLFLAGSAVARPVPLGGWQELPLNLLGALACAVLSYYALERPMMRLGRRIFSASTPASTSLSAPALR